MTLILHIHSINKNVTSKSEARYTWSTLIAIHNKWKMSTNWVRSHHSVQFNPVASGCNRLYEKELIVGLWLLIRYLIG